MRDGGVTPRDWLHFVLSLLFHDIGYVGGVCRGDRGGRYVTGRGEQTVERPAVATDAFLTPYHVDRGRRFVGERFGGHRLIDAAFIQRNLEMTRFPVPSEEDSRDTTGFPGLLRAADPIGQLGDPRYLKRIPALFHEFAETGVAARLGYASPDDLRRRYPRFYWQQVHPYLQEGLRCLAFTQQGQQQRAQLFAHVFEVEHEAQAPGAGQAADADHSLPDPHGP